MFKHLLAVTCFEVVVLHLVVLLIAVGVGTVSTFPAVSPLALPTLSVYLVTVFITFRTACGMAAMSVLATGLFTMS